MFGMGEIGNPVGRSLSAMGSVGGHVLEQLLLDQELSRRNALSGFVGIVVGPLEVERASLRDLAEHSSLISEEAKEQLEEFQAEAQGRRIKAEGKIQDLLESARPKEIE